MTDYFSGWFSVALLQQAWRFALSCFFLLIGAPERPVNNL